MKPLEDMAKLAASKHIRGRSFKRNSILKPLDIILTNLDREPKPELRDLVRHGSARQIFDHLSRIAGAGYNFGAGKQEQVTEYVNLFFEGILNDFHRGDVNRLLQRDKLIRSAYLIYFYNALPDREKKESEKDQLEEVNSSSEE